MIDTRQVQRLRYLTQLGSLFFVFPSGDFSRFEHSMGVAHLCGVFADKAFKNGGADNISIAE
jgi:HD superfamily phosphohydrolase